MKHSIYLKSKPKRSNIPQNGITNISNNAPFSVSPNRSQFKPSSPPPPPVHPKSLSPSNNINNSQIPKNIYYSTSNYSLKN